MTATVPRKNITLECSGEGQRIRAALPVASRNQWADFAQVSAHLHGRGVTLATIPPGDADVDTEYDMSAFLWPNDGIVAIVWLVSLRTTSAGTASGDFYNVHGSEVLATWALDKEDRNVGRSFRVIQPVSGTLSTAIRTLRVRKDDGSADVRVSSAVVVELPVSTVADPDDDTVTPGAPIYADATDVSLDATLRSLHTAREKSRRAHMVARQLTTAINTTATTFTSGVVFTQSVVHPRSIYGDATASISWSAYVRANGGTGELQVQTFAELGATTDTTVATITSTTYTVMTGTVLARTEDVTLLASNGGIRDSESEAVRFSVRRVTGTSVDVLGFWVGEALTP